MVLTNFSDSCPIIASTNTAAGAIMNMPACTETQRGCVRQSMGALVVTGSGLFGQTTALLLSPGQTGRTGGNVRGFMLSEETSSSSGSRCGHLR